VRGRINTARKTTHHHKSGTRKLLSHFPSDRRPDRAALPGAYDGNARLGGKGRVAPTEERKWRVRYPPQTGENRSRVDRVEQRVKLDRRTEDRSSELGQPMFQLINHRSSNAVGLKKSRGVIRRIEGKPCRATTQLVGQERQRGRGGE
jgi:hypothetical protein